MTQIVLLIYVAVSAVLLTNALDDFMQKGMIFRGYKYWLTVITLRKGVLSFLYKPLGGCIVCTNIWVFFLLLAVFPSPMFNILAGIGIANGTLKLGLRYGLL